MKAEAGEETVRWAASSAVSPHSRSSSRAASAAVPTETTALLGDDDVTTPLLRENGNSDDQDETQHAPWKENDGKPWWKRPSVRIPFSLFIFLVYAFIYIYILIYDLFIWNFE